MQRQNPELLQFQQVLHPGVSHEGGTEIGEVRLSILLTCAKPASVIVVPLKSSVDNRDKPIKWLSPASVMGVR